MPINRWLIELDKDQRQELETLMQACGACAKTDYLNAALTLMQWAIKEKQDGRVIASVNEKNDSYKELAMPILSEVKPN